MIKRPLIRAMAVAGISAGMLISATANAEFTVANFPAIQDGFPLDMTQWVSDDDRYSWNPANVRRGKHPDRPDLDINDVDKGGVVYIFKNKDDADAWWNPVTNPTGMPDGIPDKAVAYVHWALDNDSGKFPGIMAFTDDPDFQNRNCIMSSGTAILAPDPDDESKLVITTKKCGNPPASAKRFKLVILQADQPIDLIFNMERKGLTYYEYDENPVPDVDPNGISLVVTDDIFRNYRLLMKVGNGTGTDGGGRVGTRLAGVKVDLGYTTDFATGAFDATTNDDSDGLAWEIRQCVEKRYWDKAWDHEISGTDYCDAQWREVFLPHEFATFSPGMYASIDDPRNEAGGYWDLSPAGMPLPPTKDIYPTTPLIQFNSIDSGVDTKDTPQTGAITNNYFDVGANQAAGSTVPDNMFGYLMYYGVFADDDPGNLPLGIYIDDDGDSETEGSLHAWWDGSSTNCCFRWGIHGGPNGEAAWSIVSEADLAEMKDRPLSETETLEPPRYELGYMDDLGGLNMDTFVKITEPFDVEGKKTFTIRLTGQSVDDANVPASALGVPDSDWVANLPADASDFDPIAPDDPATDTTTSSGGGGSSSLGWITVGLLGLGLLFRRKRS